MSQSRNLTLTISIAIMAALSGCGKQSSSSTESSRNSSSDVQACRGDVERAIARAQNAGKSDTALYRAGEEALNACMARKGY